MLVWWCQLQTRTASLAYFSIIFILSNYLIAFGNGVVIFLVSLEDNVVFLDVLDSLLEDQFSVLCYFIHFECMSFITIIIIIIIIIMCAFQVCFGSCSLSYTVYLTPSHENEH